jgi:glycosyltransferase involved in cell wall biosynthesis
MKITIVLGAFFPVPPIMGGAVEKGWFALAQEFARRGHEVTQVSRWVSQFPKIETIADVTHLRVRGFDAPRSLTWLKFLDLIYSRRVLSILPAADIVVTNTFWLPLFLRNTKYGKIYVHVARYPKGQLRFYRHADRLQAPSDAIAEAIKTEVPDVASKIRIIPYPTLADEEIDPPTPIADRVKKIIFVGRVHPEKGVHLLVKAFAASESFADWKLVVIGPWEGRHGGGGAKYSDQLRAPDNADIEFRGPIFDADELTREYRSARLFVYPSLAERGETFGLAPLEAMAQGCAVLVSDLACFRDFISDNETGFIFNHRAADPAASLREKMRSIMNDDSLLERVAQKGYRKSKEFSLGNIAAQFLQDFESLR